MRTAPFSTTDPDERKRDAISDGSRLLHATGSQFWTAPTMWAILGLGTVLRLVIAVLPERLLTGLTWDDSYYYIRVAQNVFEGAGSSFDGIHPTNGYHPLWLLIIAPFTAMSGGFGLVRVLVLVQTLIGLATAMLLIRALRPRIGTAPLAILLAVWWLNPMSVVTSVAGLESALATLGVVVLIMAGFRYREAPTLRNAAIIGVCIGVAFLARSDSVFATAAVLVWLYLPLHRNTSTTLPLLFKHLFAAGSSAALVVTPWFMWCFVRFGTFEQASTKARPLVLWNLFERTGRTGSSVPSHIWTMLAESLRFLLGDWALVLGWSPWLFVGGAVVGILVLRRGRASQPVVDVATLGMTILASGTVLAVVHAGVRLVPRWYYFDWVRLGIGLLAAGVIAWFIERGLLESGTRDARSVHRVSRAMSATLLIALFGTAGTIGKLRNPEFEWHSTMVAAGRWLNENTEPGERIVSFNAGTLSYFSDRPVINLDGVINNSALEALKTRDLANYICASGAGWYADFDPIMLDEHEAFMGSGASRIGLEPVQRFGSPEFPQYGESDLVIHRLSCSE